MDNKDKLFKHLTNLEELHRTLDKQIKTDYDKRITDADLNKLKKKKLQIKDQIEKLRKKIK